MARALSQVALGLAIGLLAGTAVEAQLIPVSIRLEVELSDLTFLLARAEVERIFAQAGLEFRWLPAEAPAVASVVVAQKPLPPVILGCRRRLHDHRLGHTVLPARRVTIWAEQAARAASGVWDAGKTPFATDRQLGRALGRALAHELGHLLLGEKQHRREGLMRAAFSHRELTAEGTGAFRLSGEEIRRLTERAAALAAAGQN